MKHSRMGGHVNWITFLYIAAAVLATSACGHFMPALSEQQVREIAPATKRRVFSIRDIPAEVQRAVFDDRELQQLKDRKEPWSGGCLAGTHFLEAGETPDGWWVYYESGGVVDIARVTVVTRKGGEWVVTAEKGIP